jgi:purine-binding chemotaxis protein CheW
VTVPTEVIRVERPVASIDELHVVFRVGTAEYALAANHVVQMESFTGATPVPGAPPWVMGLMQVRGRVVPVIDLRARFGVAAPGGDDDQARVVVVARGQRVVGLRVDRAREVLVVSAAAIQPVPPALESSTGFVGGIARVGERLLLIIDLDRILHEDPADGH